MGQKVEQHFPDNVRIVWTNNTGGAVVRDRPIRLNGRWVVPLTDIPNGGTGTVITAGRVELTKATGFAVAVGDNIWWDSANSRITTTPTGDLLGRAASAAVSADTLVNVDVNQLGNGRFAGRITGSAAGAGLAINTGLGVVPRAYSVISRQANGTRRTQTSEVLGTAGNAGIITVVTSAGAADDTHDVIAEA
jgi:predicted RecA/RadA family phage recombinase